MSLSADPARGVARPVPAAAPQPLLELEGLVQRFGERTVLEVAAWAVAPDRAALCPHPPIRRSGIGAASGLPGAPPNRTVPALVG